MRALPASPDDIDAAPVLRPKTLGRHPAREDSVAEAEGEDAVVALRAVVHVKRLGDGRRVARNHGAVALSQACKTFNVGNDQIAEAFDTKRDAFAASLKASGNLPIGEAAYLLPVRVAFVTLLTLLQGRLRLELETTAPRTREHDDYRLAASDIDRLLFTITRT